MKYLFSLLLFVSATGFTQDTASLQQYQKPWATYFGGQGYLIRCASHDRGGNFYIAGEINPSRLSLLYNENYYNQYFLNSDTSYRFRAGDILKPRSLLAKFSPSGHLLQSAFLEGSVTSIDVDGVGRPYIIACLDKNDNTTQTSPNVWSPSAYFIGAYTFSVMLYSLNTDLTKNWQIYLGQTTIGYNNHFLDDDGNMYFTSVVTPNQVGTPGVYKQTSDTVATFLFKLSPQGQLIWGTFLDGQTNGYVPKLVGSNKISLFYYEDPNYLQSHTSDFLTSNAFWTDPSSGKGMVVFDASTGKKNYGSFLPLFASDIELDNTSTYLIYQFFVYDSTVVLPGLDSTVYQPQRKSINSLALMRLDKYHHPVWSTYIGGTGGESNAQLKLFNGELYLTSITGSIDIKIPDSTLQPHNAGGSDYFVMKFDSTGRQLWGSYFGGPGDEWSNSSIEVTNDSTFYLAGTTESRSGIATPGSYETTFSLQQVQIDSNYMSYGNGFIAKFQRSMPRDTTQTPIDTHPIDSVALVLYPNPNKGNFAIKGTVLAQKDFVLNIYNAEGRKVATQKLLRSPLQNFVFERVLVPDVYFLKLESLDGLVKKVFKLVVR